MAKYVKGIIVLILFAGLIATSACGTFVWNPSGAWTFQMTISALSLNWPENLTLTGSDAAGTVATWRFLAVFNETGTYTKVGDFGVTINFTYPWLGYTHTVIMNCTSTEDNPNNITGSGTWTVPGSSWGTQNMTFTAVKTSNLQ